MQGANLQGLGVEAVDRKFVFLEVLVRPAGRPVDEREIPPNLIDCCSERAIRRRQKSQMFVGKHWEQHWLNNV